MARSTYIYLVTDGPAGPPVAAFTVKHELATWCERRGSVVGLTFWRIGDGGSREPVEMEAP